MGGPGERRLHVGATGAQIDALGLVDEGDAVLDRADQRAQVAADAFGVDDLEVPLAVDAWR